MNEPLEQILHGTLTQFRSETGAIHRTDAQTQLLHFVAQTGLPPQLLEVVKTIPVAKGIADEADAKQTAWATRFACQSAAMEISSPRLKSGLCVDANTWRRKPTGCKTSPIHPAKF
jgi:hypothetical protein